MKQESGKITVISENELFDLYLKRGMDEILSFSEYKRQFISQGTRVIEPHPERCMHMDRDGICWLRSDESVQEYCVEGPCSHEDDGKDVKPLFSKTK